MAEAAGGAGISPVGRILSGVAVALGCVLFLGGFVWGALLYQPYTVPTDSMDPTVKPGDRVLAERVDGDEVRRGDVVVFQDSVWGSVPMVKRVVGVGGDKVACCDSRGRLTVGDQAIDEPYVRSARGKDAQRPFGATVVPEGKLFLLGDNRLASLDSTAHLDDGDHGAVPRSAVQARVDAVAWPISGLGVLERAEWTDELPGEPSEPGPVRLLAVAIPVGAVLIFGGAAWAPIARRVNSSPRG
ncbi:signal peptidase I [Streptomyces sulphureus]|uniref:signal peptidase I n=1 Tax=Streptomyces sulphureus TaxID=47758 RepID=UPI0004775E86|nr:signal peptidase I [Streptomyces sulphureus]